MLTVMLAVLAQVSYARLPFGFTVGLAVLAVAVGVLALVQQFRHWRAGRRGRNTNDDHKP